MPTPNEKVYAMSFAKVYPLLVNKAVKKGRTAAEVDEVTSWLTGYSPEQIAAAAASEITYGDFFHSAPAMNPARALVTGTICGAGGNDRGASHAGHPLSGQAGGRTGQGQADGKDSPQGIKEARHGS